MPKVSVVILSSVKLPQFLLGDLALQSFKDFEIIRASEKGIVFAMNEALKKARGELFARIDSDVRLHTQWLEELVKPFDDATIAGVTGPTYVPKERRKNRDSIRLVENPNFFLRWLFDNKPYACAKIYKCGSVSYGSNFETGEDFIKGYFNCDHLEGTNWICRTDLIRKVGGFDPAFDGVAEWFDTDVEFKIKKLGYELRYAPEAYLWHMLEKGEHYEERFEGIGRIKNWLRFHKRHSRFHYKMIVFFFLMIGYFIWKKLVSLFRR